MRCVSMVLCSRMVERIRIYLWRTRRVEMACGCLSLKMEKTFAKTFQLSTVRKFLQKYSLFASPRARWFSLTSAVLPMASTLKPEHHPCYAHVGAMLAGRCWPANAQIEAMTNLNLYQSRLECRGFSFCRRTVSICKHL